MENQKAKIISVVALVALALIVITATYAYFQAQTGEGSQTDIKINANTVDTFTFETGSAINLSLDQTSFASGAGNITGNTYASAKLTANNKTNNATNSYNLYLNISDNNFGYTQSTSYPEILLTIKDASNNEITSISGLEYKTITDGKGASISGFDITTKTGLITLLSNRELTTTSTKTDTWTITATFVNYNADQSKNAGKSFSGQVLISKDSFDDYTPNTINTLNATKSGTNLTVNLNVEQGSNEIDKYYYAIEESNGIAMLDNNTSIVQRLSNKLAANTLTYVESTSSSYTFTNLSASKNYNVYAYAIDKKKIKTNTYSYNFSTTSYVLPSITNVTTSSTSNLVTVNVTTSKGTSNISKYYYSIDNGNTFMESASNSYTFNNLTNGFYRIIVKVMDSNSKYSNIYVTNAKLDGALKFIYEGTEYEFKSGMTLASWSESIYNTFGYYIDDNTAIEVGKSYTGVYCNGESGNYYIACDISSTTDGVTISGLTELNLKRLYKNYNTIGKIFNHILKTGTFDTGVLTYAGSLSSTQQNQLNDVISKLERYSYMCSLSIVNINTSIVGKNTENTYTVNMASELFKEQDSSMIKVLIFDISSGEFLLPSISNFDEKYGSYTITVGGSFILTAFLEG